MPEPTHYAFDDVEQEIRDEIGDPVPLFFAASVVYVPALIVSILISLFVTGTIPGRANSLTEIVENLILGVAVGVGMVVLTRVLALALRSLQELDGEFRAVLSPLSIRQLLMLSLLSGTAEECFFRGVLQPWLGYVATSLLFGVVHFVPGSRVLFPWTVFALGGGFIFGFLAEHQGSLLAPVVAHILYNGLNIWFIRRRP